MKMKWYILFSLINIIIIINCDDDYLCNYILNKSDNSVDICISNKCNEIIDPSFIMVKPNNCKTKILYLKFSSYKNFNLFLNKIQWKLSDLFILKSNNQIRKLRIYINKIDFDDKPINHDQLNRLGNNIDLFELYLQNINNQYDFYQLIHYYPNDPQWNIIQIQFNCNPLMRFDKNPCSIQIIPPTFLSPRRPFILPNETEIIVLSTSSLSSSSSSLIIESNKKSNDLIIIILVPLLIMLIIIIIIFIFIIRKRSTKKSLQSQSSSIPSLSNNLDTNNQFSCECRGNAQPYQISRLPSPHKDSLYKEPEKEF